MDLFSARPESAAEKKETGSDSGHRQLGEPGRRGGGGRATVKSVRLETKRKEKGSQVIFLQKSQGGERGKRTRVLPLIASILPVGEGSFRTKLSFLVFDAWEVDREEGKKVAGFLSKTLRPRKKKRKAIHGHEAGAFLAPRNQTRRGGRGQRGVIRISRYPAIVKGEKKKGKKARHSHAPSSLRA